MKRSRFEEWLSTLKLLSEEQRRLLLRELGVGELHDPHAGSVENFGVASQRAANEIVDEKSADTRLALVLSPRATRDSTCQRDRTKADTQSGCPHCGQTRFAPGGRPAVYLAIVARFAARRLTPSRLLPWQGCTTRIGGWIKPDLSSKARPWRKGPSVAKSTQARPTVGDAASLEPSARKAEVIFGHRRSRRGFDSGIIEGTEARLAEASAQARQQSE